MVQVPLATSPTQRAPGVALLFDFLATPAGAGSGQLRGLIVGSKSSAGSASTDTLYQDMAGEAGVKTLAGPGMFASLAARAVFREYPGARVDFIAPPVPSGAAAAGTFTFADATHSSTDVTVAQTVTATVAGREVSIVWLVGETEVQAATKLVAAINSKLAGEAPVVASNTGGTARICTVTCVVNGVIGNDITISVSMSGGAGGSVVASGAKLTSGSGEIDITNSLTAVSTQEYDFILLVTSNTDAVSSSSSSNPSRLADHIATHASGMNAKLQQGVVGCTSSLSSLKAATAAINFGQMQVVFFRGAQSMPCEWAGAEVGARMRERQRYSVKNRIKMLYLAKLYGPVSRVVSDLSDAEIEDALQHGITPGAYDANGKPWPLRPVSMYWQDSNGNADDRILDVTRVDGMFDVGKDLRTYLPEFFKGKSISPDTPLGDDQLPPDVVEIGDVRIVLIARLRVWQRKGVISGPALDAAIGTAEEPGALICKIDDVNPNMIDIVVPEDTIKPIALWSMVFQQVAA